LRLRRHHASLFQLSYVMAAWACGELDTLGFQYGQALNEVDRSSRLPRSQVDFGAPVTVTDFPGQTRLRGVEGVRVSATASGAP